MTWDMITYSLEISILKMIWCEECRSDAEASDEHGKREKSEIWCEDHQHFPCGCEAMNSK